MGCARLCGLLPLRGGLWAAPVYEVYMPLSRRLMGFIGSQFCQLSKVDKIHTTGYFGFD
jgi:hypothetical protein